MKVKCIDNQNVEDFLTKEKVYEVIEHDHRENYFTVVDDVFRVAEYAKFHFEVVPSIDDVIKDKEWEKRANAYQKIIDYKNQNEEKRIMNGLEAIELMKQGKMIKGGIWIYSTDSDGVIWLKNESCTGWVEAEMFNILANDYEEYIEPKLLTGWERNMGGNLYSVLAGSEVEDIPDTNSDYDNRVYEVANYFSTREKAEEINFKQTLFRKLQRFSDENGGNEIDWNDGDQEKYYIFYDRNRGNRLRNSYVCNHRCFGQVYFISRDVACSASELFYDDLIKYFTHEWSEGNE